MKKKRRSSVSYSSVFFKITVISALSGITVFFCLTALLSLILLIIDIPYRLYGIFSVAVIIFSAFASGNTGGYHRRKKGIITGMMCSVFVFIFAAGIFLFTSEKADFYRTVFTFIICILSGAAGGVRGVNIHIKGRPFVYKTYNQNK